MLEIVLLLFLNKDTGVLSRNFGINVSSMQEVYIDSEKKVSINEILSGKYDDEFQMYHTSGASSSLSDSNYWVRIDLQASIKDKELTILEVQKPHCKI